MQENKLKIINFYKTVILLLTVLVFSFSGCGSENKKEISEDKLLKMTEELAACDAFESKLETVDKNIVLNTYKVSGDDISVISAYMGEGASAEEITLFKCSDGKKMKECIDEYLKEKKKNYESYMPKEVRKIEAAIVKEYKGYILVCISDSEKTVENIIKSSEK